VARAAAVAVATCCAVAACSLRSLDGYSGGPVAAEAGAGEGGNSGGDAGTPGGDGGSAAPVTITTVGSVAKGTGLPMQSHLAFAEGAGVWVLFYFDSAAPQSVRTRTSADFVTWTEGAALDLPVAHRGEGRNLAVAYAPLGSTDVFELALSLKNGSSDRRHYNARATLAGGVIAFGPVTQVSSTPAGDPDLDPDGPAIGVANDGFVTTFTGWWTNNPDGGSGGTGNEYAFRSSVADVGGTFAPTWSGTRLETVPTICNARGVVALGSSDLLALWESGDSNPNPTDIRFARANGASWSKVDDVFTQNAAQDPGDWAALAVSATEVHLVRLALDGTFAHRRYDGNGWSDGAAIPPERATVGGGIALARGPSGPMLLAIAEGGGAVRATTWDGTRWGTWATVVPAGAPRAALVSYSSPRASKSAVAWTETSGAGFSISAAELR
jgi:hypothetical protein